MCGTSGSEHERVVHQPPLGLSTLRTYVTVGLCKFADLPNADAFWPMVQTCGGGDNLKRNLERKMLF